MTTKESFRSKTRLYKVYHIHLKGDNDLTSGYIGITRRSLSYRLSQHFKSKRPVGETLRKIGKENIEITLLKMLPKELALDMEYVLRPKMYMGWNCRAGGDRRTVNCPSCGTYLPKSKTGSFCIKCRETRFQKGQVPHNYGTGKRYLLTDPEGNTYTPTSLVEFCREHGLTPQNLRKVAKGTRKNHKGWIAKELS